jgi:hypothetical protein
MEFLPDEIMNDINRLEGRKTKPTRKTPKKQAFSFVYEPEAEPSSSFQTTDAVDANNLRLVTPVPFIQTKDNVANLDADIDTPESSMPASRKGVELLKNNMLKMLDQIGASNDEHEAYPTEMVNIT